MALTEKQIIERALNYRKGEIERLQAECAEIEKMMGE